MMNIGNKKKLENFVSNMEKMTLLVDHFNSRKKETPLSFNPMKSCMYNQKKTIFYTRKKNHNFFINFL